MTFSLLKLQENEHKNRSSIDNLIKDLEKYLRKLHAMDLIPNSHHKQTFWLMDALTRYNIRRLRLFKNASLSDMTEEEWLDFDKDMVEFENNLIFSTKNFINEKEKNPELMKVIKNYFWYIDGFIRFKLRHCKFYAIKNNLDCDIQDEDYDENSSNNPLFDEPSTFNVTRQTLIKLFGSKVSKQITREILKEIKENANNLSDIQSLVEDTLLNKDNNYSELDINNTINNCNSELSKELSMKKNTANHDEIFIETKSCNPLTREKKSCNPFTSYNPLINSNMFIKNNPMFEEEDRKEKIKRMREKMKKIQLKREEREEKEKKEEKNLLYEIKLEQLIIEYREKYPDKVANMSHEERYIETEKLRKIAWEFVESD